MRVFLHYSRNTFIWVSQSRNHLLINVGFKINDNRLEISFGAKRMTKPRTLVYRKWTPWTDVKMSLVDRVRICRRTCIAYEQIQKIHRFLFFFVIKFSGNFYFKIKKRYWSWNWLKKKKSLRHIPNKKAVCVCSEVVHYGNNVENVRGLTTIPDNICLYNCFRVKLFACNANCRVTHNV